MTNTTFHHHEYNLRVEGGGVVGETEIALLEFTTSYECTACEVIREMETSLQVCAFADGYAACGAVDVRFSAIGISESIHLDS